MNLIWTKFKVKHHSKNLKPSWQTVIVSYILSLELTSYIQAADDSKSTDSPAEHSSLSEIVSLVLPYTPTYTLTFSSRCRKKEIRDVMKPIWKLGHFECRVHYWDGLGVDGTKALWR